MGTLSCGCLVKEAERCSGVGLMETDRRETREVRYYHNNRKMKLRRIPIVPIFCKLPCDVQERMMCIVHS